jgi:hypothetical protein
MFWLSRKTLSRSQVRLSETAVILLGAVGGLHGVVTGVREVVHVVERHREAPQRVHRRATPRHRHVVLCRIDPDRLDEQPRRRLPRPEGRPISGRAADRSSKREEANLATGSGRRRDLLGRDLQHLA